MTAAESVAELDRVTAEIVARYPHLIERGVAIVAHRARQGGQFSANDIRPQLRAAGIGPRQSGAVFSTAMQRRIVRIVQYVMHDDPRTRHRIALYEQRVGPDPRPRDLTGRFTPAPTTAQPTPFDIPLFPEL